MAGLLVRTIGSFAHTAGVLERKAGMAKACERDHSHKSFSDGSDETERIERWQSSRTR
jgi:hypothetical protein